MKDQTKEILDALDKLNLELRRARIIAHDEGAPQDTRFINQEKVNELENEKINLTNKLIRGLKQEDPTPEQIMTQAIHDKADEMFKAGEEMLKEGAKSIALGMVLYEHAKREESNQITNG